MRNNYPPYMNATGLVKKILEKIKEAATPDRFTQDFMNTKLGYTGGSANAFIPFAKRIGLLSGDGSPTELYKQFRNPKTSRTAIAKAIHVGYEDLFIRNENAYKLNRSDLEGLIMEATGLEKGNTVIRAITGTLETLKGFADFESKEVETDDNKKDTSDTSTNDETYESNAEVKLNLSYSINLVMPKTDDVAVFNAIFKSLKENLLKK